LVRASKFGGAAMNEEFNRVADSLEGWRNQQIAAMTPTQRRLYEQALRKTEEAKTIKTNELADGRLDEIKKETVSRVLEQPTLENTIQGQRLTLNEATARQLTETHFRPNQPPDYTPAGRLVARAAHMAKEEIDRQHERAIDALTQRGRATTDELLRVFERARNMQPQLTDEFKKANLVDKARTDFREAVKGEGISVDKTKSDAIAQAIAKVNQKELDELSRRDLGHGRERLTDTFNKHVSKPK
jgi:hypothetical protein